MSRPEKHGCRAEYAWQPITRRFFRAVQAFGGQAEMTDPRAASGTDRVAEVARRMPRVDIVVNVQGDEPEIAGSSIDLAIELLQSHPEAVMSTLATPIRSRRQLEAPACVKVAFDCAGPAHSTSAAVRFHTPANGATSCSMPIRRISTSTSGCTPIAASFSWSLPVCRRRAWSRSKSSNSFACCKRDTRSWSASSMSRRSGSTRRRITRRSLQSSGGFEGCYFLPVPAPVSGTVNVISHFLLSSGTGFGPCPETSPMLSGNSGMLLSTVTPRSVRLSVIGLPSNGFAGTAAMNSGAKSSNVAGNRPLRAR